VLHCNCAVSPAVYKVMVEVKGTCYSAAYMSRLEQQHFTVSEVAIDWHELMIPWRIMMPSSNLWASNILGYDLSIFFDAIGHVSSKLSDKDE